MRKEYEGSITVEAAFIVPIVILVIITSILFSFYICDIVCVRAVVENYCVTEGDNEKTEEMMCSDIYEGLKNQTLVAQIKTINVNKKKDKADIEVLMNFHIGYWNITKNDRVKVTMYCENTRQSIVKQKVFVDIVSHE